MNIREAKEQIKNAMQAYFAKDEYGNFLIPPQAQRPVFLMGPPGIGKTAVMSEIAQELGVGLVSYSMTHHTRQSALGLPMIVQKSYNGKEYNITEYTMSEIIASVYDMMEESGVREGILFLDEINCASETLTPTMLQFLQYKTFGKHAVPGGWIVVTAGNPPEYNRNVREFDIVTWDRLKRVDVEPDYGAWKDYAREKGVHAAVLTYLDIRKEHFYKIENTVDGKRFVTARGWDDLSEMLKLYERCSIPVTKLLTEQYLQDKEIAEDFALYYELFNKYRSDYQVESILSGRAPAEIKKRASAAPFDEHLSLLGLMQDNVSGDIRAVSETEDTLQELLRLLREVKAGASMSDKLSAQETKLQKAESRGALSAAARRRGDFIIDFIRRYADKQFGEIKEAFDFQIVNMKRCAEKAGDKLKNLFLFCEEVWPEGQELLILVTELTVNSFTARFIARYGCDEYYRHNEELMFYERQTEIIKDLEALEMTI